MEGHGSDTHRHGNFGQLLADAVLHDAPQIEGIVGFVRDVSPPLSAGLQLLPRHIITARRHLRVGAITRGECKKKQTNMLDIKFEIYF